MSLIIYTAHLVLYEWVNKEGSDEDDCSMHETREN